MSYYGSPPVSLYLLLLICTHSGIIAGIDWVANQHTRGKKSVAK